MKNLLKIIFLMCIALTVKAQSELKVFTDWTSTSGTQYFYYKNKVKTDAGGNVYIAGATLNSSNNYDILVAKYNSSGVQQWIQQYNGAGNGDDMALGLFIGGTGNVYITGTVTTASNVDAITIKFNQYGVIQWVATYNGTGNAFDAGADVIEDGSYNVYITGSSFNASGNTDFITAKYNSGGTQQWVSRYDYASQMNDAGVKIAFRNGNLNVSGLAQTNSTTYRASTLTYNLSGTLIGTNFGTSSSSGIDQVNDMVTDASGNIYIAAAIPVAGQGYNYAIIKLSSSLSLLWERTYNGADNLNDVATGLKVDASGNVYATGYSTTSTQGKNIVTVKYNSSGTLQWSLTYNNALNTNDEANAMAIDASGNIYIAGFTDTEADGTDYFTIKYNASGNVVWTIQSDGNAHLNDKATDIAIDNNGDIVVTGQSETAPNEFEYLTIKYVEKYVITPTDYNSESPANSFSYYANKGQLINTNGSQVSDIKYYSTNSSPALYIKDYSHSYVFASIDTSTATNDTLHRIDITYDKVNASAKTYPLEERADYVNYFLSQCPDGITKVHGNQRLITTNLYSNIDLMYSSNQDGIKYYYIVKPSANPSNIHITFTGASSFYLDGSTNELTIYSSIGSITFERPTVYQLDASNNIIPITGWTADWVVNGTSNKYYFNIGAYDNTKPLIIQVDRGHSVQQVTQNGNLEWSTYYGGSNDDEFYDIKTDDLGKVYVAGSTISSNFPTYNGLYSTPFYASDAVILKFDSAGVRKWATYYGGSLNDMGSSLIVNTSKYVYLTGSTFSSDFPIDTLNGAFMQYTYGGSGDIFIVKLDSNGRRELGTNSHTWSTYFGGTGNEKGSDLKNDGNNNLYLVGSGTSASPQAFQTGSYNNMSNGSGFIAKFNSNDSLVWSAIYAGTEQIKSIAIDESNSVFITGSASNNLLPIFEPTAASYVDSTFNGGGTDVFIANLSETNNITWSTYYGGGGAEIANAIFVKQNNIYLTGNTTSSNFPHYYTGIAYIDSTNGGDDDIFILKFSYILNCEVCPRFIQEWSTYYGGSGIFEVGNDIAVDYMGDVHITGYTNSSDFSTTNLANAYNDGSINGGGDAFILSFASNLYKTWSTFFGGVSNDRAWGLAIDKDARLYMTGTTSSKGSDFPLQDLGGNPAAWYQYSNIGTGYKTDGFISRFDLSPVFVAAGISDYKPIILNSNFIVYPNPNYGNITLEINLGKPNNISISVFNIIGDKVYSEFVNDVNGLFQKKIDISNLSNGVYIIQIMSDDFIDACKILKQ